jgi:hypothetical protein
MPPMVVRLCNYFIYWGKYFGSIIILWHKSIQIILHPKIINIREETPLGAWGLMQPNNFFAQNFENQRRNPFLEMGISLPNNFAPKNYENQKRNSLRGLGG